MDDWTSLQERFPIPGQKVRVTFNNGRVIKAVMEENFLRYDPSKSHLTVNLTAKKWKAI